MFALAENYPNLKANEQFSAPQNHPDRFGRKHPTRAPFLQRYGSRPEYAVQMFPSNIVAEYSGVPDHGLFRRTRRRNPKR
ncbi:MAG: LemA family protein [Lewinellaceae bacterium]|nr:LemA family protein [Lewinellaceae bacterium]